MKRKVVETVLEKARRKVEAGWCQGASALRADGKKTLYFDPLAVSWSSWGSIVLSAENKLEVQNEAVDHFRAVIGFVPIEPWNDKKERTKAQVLFTFDRALLRATR